jgi:hypothetical protein
LRQQDNYDKVLQALKDMQAHIEERMRPMASEVIQAEVARIQSDSKRHQDALASCLSRIDERILSCRSQLDEYNETCSLLISLNERLVRMGEEPVELSKKVVFEDLGEMILSRIEGLRVDGKI